jgi:hypothetical protein
VTVGATNSSHHDHPHIAGMVALLCAVARELGQASVHSLADFSQHASRSLCTTAKGLPKEAVTETKNPPIRAVGRGAGTDVGTHANGPGTTRTRCL